MGESDKDKLFYDKSGPWSLPPFLPFPLFPKCLKTLHRHHPHPFQSRIGLRTSTSAPLYTVNSLKPHFSIVLIKVDKNLFCRGSLVFSFNSFIFFRGMPHQARGFNMQIIINCIHLNLKFTLILFNFQCHLCTRFVQEMQNGSTEFSKTFPSVLSSFLA